MKKSFWRNKLVLSALVFSSVNILPAQNAAVSWTTGTFLNNSVLELFGSTSSLVYGVNLGSGAQTTANGFLLQNGSSPLAGNVTVGGGDSTFNIPGPFLAGGSPTSSDVNFNSALGDATFWTNPGNPNNSYNLNNLVIGQQYLALFLMADTRPDSSGRTFSITSGGQASASQQYAFQNGIAALGGYAAGAFTADASSQIFFKPGDGQLNEIVLYTVVPEPSSAAMILAGFSLLVGTRFRAKAE